jgi:hypothetical protein
MNEKIITCQDYHGFKWKNINIYLILNAFFGSLTPFLTCWIVTQKEWKIMNLCYFHEDEHIQAHVQAKKI